MVAGASSLAKSIGLSGSNPALIGLLVLIVPTVRTVLSLVDDVLSYLEKYSVASGLLPERPIRSRFRRVVDYLSDDGPFDRWVIVAHSQGTVVVLDELAADASVRQSVFRRPASEERIRIYDSLAGDAGFALVTCGSPFSHLYQHYFPLQYPPLNDPRWAALLRRVGRWHNVYREDDFVGTEIETGVGEDKLTNQPIGLGGHTGYWSDDRFLVQLEQVLYD